MCSYVFRIFTNGAQDSAINIAISASVNKIENKSVINILAVAIAMQNYVIAILTLLIEACCMYFNRNLVLIQLILYSYSYI